MNIYSNLDPSTDPQINLRESSLLRFAFLWLLLDQLPGGGWGKSLVRWMEANWEGMSITPDITMEQEGGLESSVLSFALYARVTGLRIAARNRPLPETVLKFQKYLDNHWDSVSQRYGMRSLRQEGIVLVPSLRHTALAAYANLLINEVHAQPNIVFDSLTAVFSADHPVYVDERNTGMTYMLLDYLASVVEEPKSRGFEELDVPDELKAHVRSWKTLHEEGGRQKFLRHEYNPLPQKAHGKSISAHPLVVPYGGFWRMSSYTHLACCLFVTDESNAQVKKLLASGVEHLCQNYADRYSDINKRYNAGDFLKPKERGIQPWLGYGNADIGSTALLLSVITDQSIRHALWRDSVPSILSDVIPLLFEDILEQWDRYLISPDIFTYTHATSFVYLLAAYDNYGKLLPAQILQEDEAYLATVRQERGLSERELNALVYDKLFKKGSELPTQIFSRSLGRLLLDFARPGRYPEGGLYFEKQDHRSNSVNRVLDETASAYSKQAFAERFEQVWGINPDQRLTKIFLDMLPAGTGKRCIDIGCGPGQYAKIFQDAGHEVFALDCSRPMLELTRNRLGWHARDRRLLELDVRDIEENLNTELLFDGIWCSATLTHLPKKLATEVVRFLVSRLRDDGVIMVSLQLRNPRLVSEDGRFFAYWNSGDDIERMLKACGLEVVTVLSSWLQMNVYNEPNINLRWDNFFCMRANPARRLPPPRETTSLAYDLIVDSFIGQHSGKPHESKVVNFIEKLPWKSGKILDAGCGPGHYVPFFWQLGYDVTGLDLSPKMIEHARIIYASELDAHPQSKFRVGDMCDSPSYFEPNSFVGVFCMAAFQHVPKKDDIAAETLRGFLEVLRPGGALLLNVQLGRAAGYEPDGRFTEAYQTPSVVCDLLGSVGFVDVEPVGDVHTLRQKDNTFQRAIELKFIDIISYKPRVPAFVSYSRSDEEYALQIKKQLGDVINVWRDMDDLSFGINVQGGIQKAIEESEYALILATENSVGSDWVKWEIMQILEEESRRGTRSMLIPIFIDDSDWPTHVKDRNGINIQDHANMESELHKLKSQLLGLKDT